MRNAIGLMLCLALGAAISFGGIIIAAGLQGGHTEVRLTNHAYPVNAHSR